MAAQFLHVDYAKRTRETNPARWLRVNAEHGTFRSAGWSAADLLAEAARQEGHCSHVEAPQPPIILHGMSPLHVLDVIEAWVEAQRQASVTPNLPRGRRYPKNRPVMAAGVISYPREDRAGWPAFRDACVAWLHRRYGARLRSVIEHRDESHPHLHYFLTPLPNEGVEAIHEGYAAQLARRRAFFAETGRRGKGERLGTHRVAAMRALQDAFHAEVASRFGLARTGPRRQRTSYADAKRRQAELQNEAELMELAHRRQQQLAAQEAERRAFMVWYCEQAADDEATVGRAGTPDSAEFQRLARDAVDMVRKIAVASRHDAVTQIARALSARYDALVTRDRPAARLSKPA